MQLLTPPHRILDTDLGRVEIDHPARDGALDHLPQRRGCFKAVTGRERHPPLRDLLRRQLTDAAITEHRGRLAEQIAELLDRHRLRVVLREVRLHEFGEREPACDASLTSQPLELARPAKLLAQLGDAWHLVEFAIALGAGIAAGSVALTGFAGDSLVEVVAASIIVWLFSAGRGASEHAERRAQQLVAVRLVAYIGSHDIYDP